MKPKCWDAICYAAGTVRRAAGPVTLSQSDCRELTAYVVQLTARGMADQPAPTETGPGPECTCGATAAHDYGCPRFRLTDTAPQGAPDICTCGHRQWAHAKGFCNTCSCGRFEEIRDIAKRLEGALKNPGQPSQGSK